MPMLIIANGLACSSCTKISDSTPPKTDCDAAADIPRINRHPISIPKEFDTPVMPAQNRNIMLVIWKTIVRPCRSDQPGRTRKPRATPSRYTDTASMEPSFRSWWNSFINWGTDGARIVDVIVPRAASRLMLMTMAIFLVCGHWRGSSEWIDRTGGSSMV